MIFAIDPTLLTHCRSCSEPMYFIYDDSLRDYCYECLSEISKEEKTA